MYHQRVAYPQNKVVELESRRGASGRRARVRWRSHYLGPWRIDVEWRDGVPRLVPAAALARTVAAAPRRRGRAADRHRSG